MATTFFPVVSTFVPANPSYHPPNTEYKVSIGYEVYNNNFNCLVFKTQICYNGKISGRRSPSFPISSLNPTLSSDLINVQNAMSRVLNFYNTQNNNAMRNCII